MSTDRKNEATERKSAQDAQRYILEKVMTETLHEMIIDLAKAAPKLATKLLQETQGKTGDLLMTTLREPTSSLCLSIAEACGTPAMKGPGEKYLSIFGMIQPSLIPKLVPESTKTSETVPAPSSSSKAVNNKKKKRKGKGKGKENESARNIATDATVTTPAIASASALPTGPSNPSQMIQSLLSDTQDKDLLLSLADTIFQDLELGDRADKEMSMPDMFALMTKAGSVVQDKVQSGDLDVARLQEQAMAFCAQIQHNPDLQNIISSNPVLASMQLDAQVQSNGDASSPATAPGTPGIGNLLMSVMSSYQGMD